MFALYLKDNGFYCVKLLISSEIQICFFDLLWAHLFFNISVLIVILGFYFKCPFHYDHV